MLCRISQSATFDTGSNYADQNAINSTSIELIASAAGNVATEGFSTDVLFRNPGGTGYYRAITHSGLRFTASGTAATITPGGQFVGDTGACDGIRFFLASGNWQALGKIQVFRRRLS
jgi:hypothetical protein